MVCFFLYLIAALIPMNNIPSHPLMFILRPEKRFQIVYKTFKTVKGVSKGLITKSREIQRLRQGLQDVRLRQ